MQVILKDGLLVLVAEPGDEANEIAAWTLAHGDHVLLVRAEGSETGRSLVLHDLGPRLDACREPINVVSNSPDHGARLISNFADTPFELAGLRFRTVESFWQGLKFASDADRRRLALLSGAQARSEGESRGYGDTITYEGRAIPTGTWQHWQLMALACQAKFDQHAEARAALLATGTRPLTHHVRNDSRTIPGVIMASIWMRIRKRLLGFQQSDRPE